MKRIWERLTHIGIGGNLDSREARRICYVNYIALLTALYLAIRILLSLPNATYCLKLFSAYIFVVCVLVLNHRHFYRAAKIVTFSSWIAGITYFTQVIKEISVKDERSAGVLMKLAANFAYDKILYLIQGF